MTRVAQDLDDAMQRLDPERAKDLEELVRNAIALAAQSARGGASKGWPAGYFETTAGALAGEPFERPPQGSLPDRDAW